MADVYQNWVLYNVGKAIKNWTEYSFDWTMLNEYNQLVAYYDAAQQQIRTSIINKWVNVPANATIDTYPWYIDQIQTWVPQSNYNTVVSVSKWAVLGYPDISYTADNYWFWWNSYLCKIWNNIFMLGVYWYRYADRYNHEHFSSYLWIYYKLEWANSWSRCRDYLWTSESSSYTWATISINNPVYINSDWSVNMNITIEAWWTGEMYNQYKKWTIGTNTIADSTSLSWEDLNNYKIYNSSISVWEIDPNDIYAIGYIIDTPLL